MPVKIKSNKPKNIKKVRIEEAPKPPKAPPKPKLQLKLALTAIECNTCGWSPKLLEEGQLGHLTCANPNCPTAGTTIAVPKIG